MKLYILVGSLLISTVFGSCGFSLSSGANFIGYWGQNSGRNEKALQSYCNDNRFTAFHIAFMNDFSDPSKPDTIGMNLASHCGTPCTGTYTGLLCCPTVASDISYCQRKGKKVLLSLGGASAYGKYSLTSSTGTTMADFLWNYFLGGSPTNGDPRPFGSTVLDGVDLDIENGENAGYSALISQLRSHYSGASKTYYISGAPQCVYPDAALGPSSGTALTKSGVTLDYIVVQFYNNEVCNVGQSSFKTSFNNWAATSVRRVMVGFLGTSGSGYLSSSQLNQALAEVWGNAKFGGVMAWDTGTVTHNTEGGTTPYATTIANNLRTKFCNDREL